MHGVHHHRATIEDSSQYVQEFNQNKKYMHLLENKCEDLETQLYRMEDIKQREAEHIKGIYMKVGEYRQELENLLEAKHNDTSNALSMSEIIDKAMHEPVEELDSDPIMK